MGEEALPFEKKKKRLYYFILSYCLIICFLSQYFFLGAYFAKSALNLNNLFQGLPEGLQFKVPYLGSLGTGSSLGPSVIGCSLSSWVLSMPDLILKKYFFKFWYIFMRKFRMQLRKCVLQFGKLLLSVWMILEPLICIPFY